MHDLEGKVAVVTGGAGGIGRGMANRFAASGMKVVLVDNNRERLDQAAAEMAEHGATVLGVPTDVTQIEDVRALAQRVLDEFGAVHVVCNNAGINTANVSIWEIPIEDWHAVIDVNLKGVLHGVHVFTPIMMEQDEGHIVNTASAAGLGSRPGIQPYVVTKSGVVALTEGLHHELERAGSQVRASVLCPGRIRTEVSMGMPGRPGEQRTQEELDESSRYMRPDEVGDLVIESIREHRFYIFTHPEAIKERIRSRADDMLLERLPTYSPAIG